MNTKEQIKAAEKYAEIHVLKHQPREMFGNIVCDFLAGSTYEMEYRNGIIGKLKEIRRLLVEVNNTCAASIAIDAIVDELTGK